MRLRQRRHDHSISQDRDKLARGSAINLAHRTRDTLQRSKRVQRIQLHGCGDVQATPGARKAAAVLAFKEEVAARARKCADYSIAVDLRVERRGTTSCMIAGALL